MAAPVLLEPGQRVHATVGGDCYLRIGDESRKLGYAQRQQLEYEKDGAAFESLPVNRAVSKLGRARLEAYQLAIGSSTVDDMMSECRALQANGRFGPVPLLPSSAWREGLINAVIHRS